MDWDGVKISLEDLIKFLLERNGRGHKPVKILKCFTGLELNKPAVFIEQEDNNQCVELPWVPYYNDNVMLRSYHLQMIEYAFGILPAEVKNWQDENFDG